MPRTEGVTIDSLLVAASVALDRSRDDRQPDYMRNAWADVNSLLLQEVDRLREIARPKSKSAPSFCSVCRGTHGREIVHPCE